MADSRAERVRRRCRELILPVLQDAMPSWNEEQIHLELLRRCPVRMELYQHIQDPAVRYDQCNRDSRIWTEEARKVMKERTPGGKPSRVAFWHLRRPWWATVVCEWCENRYYTSTLRNGCMVCGRLRETLSDFLEGSLWKKWKPVLLADGKTAPILADYLEDNLFDPALVLAFRTAQPPKGVIACSTLATS